MRPWFGVVAAMRAGGVGLSKEVWKSVQSVGKGVLPGRLG